MWIKVLGSGAGGGFPQWNCNCANCQAVRSHAPGFYPRTQSSLAVSTDRLNWLLLNASPDLREQIAKTPQLAPSHADCVRASPIKAVALTNGDVDHVAGLLSMREAQPFSVYAARRVIDALGANPIFSILQPQLVPLVELQLDKRQEVSGAQIDLGLELLPFSVPGKIALYLENKHAPNFGTQAGDTLGFKITDTKSGKFFYYIPGCAQFNQSLSDRLHEAPLVFFDGTLFHENEMIDQGLIGKTGSRMGHMNIDGPDGSLKAFEKLNVVRKIYIHLNNSNPALNDFSREHAIVTAAGWEVAKDGLEIEL